MYLLELDARIRDHGGALRIGRRQTRNAHGHTRHRSPASSGYCRAILPQNWREQCLAMLRDQAE